MKKIIYTLLILPMLAFAQEQDPCYSINDYNLLTELNNPQIDINLVPGWNMIGYPCTQVVIVSDAFSSIVNDISIVKDNNGNVYIPEFGFNGIGFLEGGQGYQIKMNEFVMGFNFCQSIQFPTIEGCTDCEAVNFSKLATTDDGSCSYESEQIFGCNYPWADNYNPNATENDESCYTIGCTDPWADNFDPLATDDDGSCITFITQENIYEAVDLWCDDPESAESAYGHISNWDVSNVTDMQYLFANQETFNDDVSDWDISSVTNIFGIFFQANEFNQDLSSWNVSSVINMTYMFFQANEFNQDLSSWDVSNVTDMSAMFFNAYEFNQDLSSWDVSSVSVMEGMFLNTNNFNQDLSSWEVSNVTDMSMMFDNTNLSLENQCAIQEIFSINENWQYDWECLGCMDETACNYNSSANVDIDSCVLPQIGFNCNELSMSFDGVDDWIEAPSIDLTSNIFTIEGWIKIPEVTHFDQTNIIDNYVFGSGGSERWGIYVGGTNPIHEAQIGQIYAPTFGIQNSPRIDDNNWHHFAFVRNEFGIVKLFIDGTFVNQSTCNLEYNLNAGFPTRINGGFHCEGGILCRFMEVEINDIQVSFDVKYESDFNSNCRIESENSLLHFSANHIENTESIVFDNSGNGNHGVIHGVTYTDDVPEVNCDEFVDTHQVGELTEGGIVFYIDETGQHGLVAALEDIEGTYEWGCYGTELFGADGEGIGTGYQNTLDIVAGCSETPIAASETLVYEGGEYNDWYLPSKDELLEMYSTIGNGSLEGNIGSFNSTHYWSSSEYDNDWAWDVNFGIDSPNSNKNNLQSVRPIRAFGNWTMGCMDSLACNFNPEANMDDGTCEYPEQGYDCDGNIFAQIGDEAFGGTVFYVDELGTRALVSANESLGPYQWGCYMIDVVDPYFVDVVGTGYKNTMDIYNNNCITNDGGMTAAEAALNYEYGGFNDWYFPSIKEMVKLFETLNMPSVYSEANSSEYWSSTESMNGNAWDIDGFYDQPSIYSSGSWKNKYNRVIPIRSIGYWVSGCMDITACNYNPEANQADWSCEYREEGYDCQGNITDYFVGMEAQGGIIFYVDQTGEHGLVASNQDYIPYIFGCYGTELIGADGFEIGDGYQNTIDISADCSSSQLASNFALNHNEGGFNDWYLPSFNELILMLNSIGGKSDFNDNPFSFMTSQYSYYRSSTEFDDDLHMIVDFSSLGGGSVGHKGLEGATNIWPVRLIRSF